MSQPTDNRLSANEIPGSAAPPARSLAANLLFFGSGVAALLYALWAAWRGGWVSDDAFITFRYAENLVLGLGLVYNPGERVEGYSNFLWTIWTALGIRLGADVERWALASSIACYLGALALLVWNSWTVRRNSPGLTPWIPVAALLGALHPDWQIFATGGLETSLFALEMTAIYVVLTRSDVGPARAAATGLLLACASMTRPDGLMLAPTVVLYLLLTGTRRPRTILALGAAFLVIWAPYTAWRVSYYGDYFPNTYYAKSAAMAWYSQGAIYLGLYFARYWPLLLGPALVAVAWRRSDADLHPEERIARARWRRSALLAAMLVTVYVGFVFRVGGDFMFARFLIPVTPLLLVLLELGITHVAVIRGRRQWLLAGIVAAGIVMTPYPFPRDPFSSVKGIVREQNFYPRHAMNRVRKEGLALRPFFAGLPVRVAFFGGEARVVYYARPQAAIECVTGLTDHQIARQPLKARGRIGHEKLASIEYLLGVRRAHFAFPRYAPGALHLDREIPHVEIEMGGVQARVLTWDPTLLDSLRQRGASIQDFPTELDGLLASPSPEYQMLDWFASDKLHRFYFANVHEPEREALFLQRLRESENGE